MSLKHLSVIAALSLAGALAITGCQRPSGNAGTTTIVQQAPAASNTNTPAGAKITPLDDPAQLCHQVRSKTRPLQLALHKYWSLVSGDGSANKSVSDPDVQAAAGEVIDLAGKAKPELEGIVGRNAPLDVSNVVRQFLEKLFKFTDAIEEAAPGETASKAASGYGDALDALNQTCKA